MKIKPIKPIKFVTFYRVYVDGNEICSTKRLFRAIVRLNLYCDKQKGLPNSVRIVAVTFRDDNDAVVDARLITDRIEDLFTDFQIENNI